MQWIQTIAVAHWHSVCDPAHHDAYFWVVVGTRSIICARPSTATGCWPEPGSATPREGARFDRHVEFVGPDGKVCVRAKTSWAIIDRTSNRPIRVPAEVIAPFVGG